MPKVELAAKEAWASWALYGIVTRMELNHVKLWNACLPEIFHQEAYADQRIVRKKLLKDSGAVLKGVAKAEHTRRVTQKTPAWRVMLSPLFPLMTVCDVMQVAKESAVELVHDIGLDLQREVDSDTMQRI